MSCISAFLRLRDALVLLALAALALPAGMGGCAPGTDLFSAAGALNEDTAAAPDQAGPRDIQQDQNDAQNVDLAREVEEADIVKLEEGFFYIANPYRGLRIIDATNADSPVLAGGVAVGGRGVELFLRDNRVFLFTAADFYNCAGRPVGFVEGEFDALLTPDYNGSRLWVIDVTDKTTPTIEEQFDFPGFVKATRRVGDVIYAVGNAVPGFDDNQNDNADNSNDNGGDNTNDNADNTNANDNNANSNDNGADNANANDNAGENSADDPVVFEPIDPALATSVFVTSISIADLADIHAVETDSFDGNSLDVQVGENALYVLGDDAADFGNTLVSYVDISDPAGQIMRRDQFRVPGTVRNRFFADEFEGVFRIVTEAFNEFDFLTAVALYTYDVSNPDQVTRLAKLPIVANESLRAVRFDGPRGYAVTFQQIDPLFVLDLADPAAPKVSGSLEVPGYSTHIVPMGDRLVAVGFDNTEGVRPAVALYDVSDPAAPTQLSRIIVGDAWTGSTSSEATVDEKALQVLEDAKLILLPFSTTDFETGGYVDSLQLIDLGADELKALGTVSHRGLVRRSGLIDGRLWVLSDIAFQTVDIGDPAAAATLKEIEIISEQDLLDAGLQNCVDSARFRGFPVEFFGFGFFGDDVVFGDTCWPFSIALPGLSLVGMWVAKRK
ncbi:Beta propeller domain protein [Phycisphaerae bacterium RAS1]|nr:Beta propeller domain protein [Phycisphaerae bacterium RAS1]